MFQAQLRTKQCVGPHMSILLEIELYVTHGLEMLVSYHFTLLLKCQLTPPWLRKQLIMIMKCVL